MGSSRPGSAAPSAPIWTHGCRDEPGHRDLNRRAHQIMSREPITVSPNASLKGPPASCWSTRSPCLPVLENGALVGIVSWKDLLRVMRGLAAGLTGRGT